MSFTIKDGTGTGKEARVTNANRLSVTSITESELVAASIAGLRFGVNTGTITLTSAAKTTLFYLKNNEVNDLVISSFIYLLGNSTGGSGNATIDIIRNPTAGGIITNANAVDIIGNYNFGSNRTLVVDAYKGATGETVVSGGSVLLSSLLASPLGRSVVVLDSLILPRGASVAIDYTPQTGNTSQAVQIGFPIFVNSFEL